MTVAWRKLGFDSDVVAASSLASVAYALANTLSSAASEGGVVDEAARTMADSAASRAVSVGLIAVSALSSAASAASQGTSAGLLALSALSSAASAASQGTSAGLLALSAASSAATALSVASSAGSLVSTLVTHAGRHKNSTASTGADELLLSDFGEPDAAVKFSNQQATDFVLHTTADTATLSSLNVSVAIGKIAYVTAESGVYVCIVAA
jgi:hypothetical protein